MKRYATHALSVLFMCLAVTGFSQNNSIKPKQFNTFPNTINCSEQELAKVFNAAPGQQISLSFSNNFIFSGFVKSNIAKYSNLRSAVISSPDYANTVFSISKITGDDGTLSYVGRIINKDYFDGYELKKNTAGNYQLIKVETDRVIPECKMF